ncbi:MAG: class I SAM-dependent methyltransferase [Spirochaetales bacterium]|nr:class I SAM-dependent methyltransferase [Spirochaetales bacterium]
MEKQIPKYIGPEASSELRKMTREEIKHRFDSETAELYSQRNPSWLPDFSNAFSLIPETLALYLKEEPLILDLGAGTGNLSRTVLESIGDARITLVDFSENMLGTVPRVLASFPGQYETITADMHYLEMPSASFDAVISSFALHHCRGTDEYLGMYQKIRSWLKPEGIFICCDIVDGGSRRLAKENERQWMKYLSIQGFDDPAIEKILANYRREDTPASLADHISLLEKAGFGTMDIIWKKYNFSVFMGAVQSEVQKEVSAHST